VREETNEVIAYICDGAPEGELEPSIDAWFQGPIEGDEVSLRADRGEEGSGEERLQALLRAAVAVITGTYTDIDGQSHDFEAEEVDIEEEAGLYWSEPAEELSFRSGTIILADGKERGTRLIDFTKTDVAIQSGDNGVQAEGARITSPNDPFFFSGVETIQQVFSEVLNRLGSASTCCLAEVLERCASSGRQ
jgi:hypothetical protein